MEVRAGYKQTEVGVIPDDWKIEQIKQLADVGRGRVISHREIAKSISNLYPVYSSQTSNDGVMGYIDTYDFDGEYITWTTDGANAGTVFYRNGKFNCTNVCGTIKLRKDNALFVSKALGVVAPKHVSRNLGNPKLMNDVVKQIAVALPSSPVEQRAIATALSDVDALLAAQDKLIAKKRDIKQAAMQQLLTGKQRLPGFSGEWEVKRMADILSRMANGAVYKATTSMGVCITRIETIADGAIDYSRTGTAEPSSELDKYKLLAGDILFSHINSLDHIGKVALFDGLLELYHGMNLLLLRANESNSSKFLYFWLTSEPARRKARNLAKQAVSQASINTTELKSMEISMPHLSEQIAIAAVLSDMDAELTALEKQRDKTRALKQGMMQELLTGRIRLV